MNDDWFDSDAKPQDIEREIAERENQLMIDKLQKEGYREGLIHITEEQEKQIQDNAYKNGFNDAKHQFKILQFIEIVLANEKFFKPSLIEQCQKLKKLDNFNGVDIEQLINT